MTPALDRPFKCAALSVIVILGGARGLAQSPASSDTVVMNPFEVSSAGDVGYLAQSSLSGSRLNTNLGDIAAPTTAFTADFLQDTAVRSVDELSLYMPSSAVIYPQANQAFFVNDAVELRIRGLPALNFSVNYFTTTLRLDLYNTDRVDQSRGANSILFGLGSPGGVVNIDSNRAVLNSTFGSVTVQPRSWNGLRAAVDYNQELIPDRVSLRVDAVTDEGGTWRYNEYDHQNRIYTALRWRVDHKTTVDFEFEHGSVNKSVGEPSTAVDAYTLWAAGGRNLSATANAAEGIQSIGATDHEVLDTGSGLLQDWKSKMTTTVKSISGSNVYLTDFSILPKAASLAAGPSFPHLTNYTRGDVFINHAFTPDFNMELAADGHDAPRDTINGATFDTLSVDPNPTLPNGLANPNAGRPYTEGHPVRNVYIDRSEALRLTTSYAHDFGKIIGRQEAAVLLESDWSKNGNLQMSLEDTGNPYSLASPENAANIIYYRTYLNLAGQPKDLVAGNWQSYPLNELIDSATNRNVNAGWVNSATGSAVNRFDLRSLMGVLQSHFLWDRLVTAVGFRNNWEDSWYSPTNVRGPATNGFVLGPYIVVPGSIDTPVRSHNLNFSAVGHLTPWLALTYNWSTDFALPSTTGSTPYGRVSAPTGRSQDVGVKVELGNRLSLNVSYFKTSDHHDYQAASALPSNPDGEVNQIWSALAAAGVAAPGGGSALSQQITDNGYTYDAVTTGVEATLIANPTDNWHVYFTLSDDKTTDTNLGTEALRYLGQYQGFWLQGTNGRVLLDGSGGLAPTTNPSATLTTVAQAVAQIQQLDYNYYTLGDGQRPLGQTPWQFAARTNYAFPADFLHGVDVGGGVRYLAGQVVAFGAATDTTSAYTVYGPGNALVDFNVGYQKSVKWFGRDFRLRIQLNVNNVFDQTRIIPMTETTTGQVLAYHLQPPRQYIVTTKLSF